MDRGIILIWLRRHWLRITSVLVVTSAMFLAWGNLIPVWIFHTLLIAMHAWIFARIGVRIHSRIKSKRE